MVTVASKSSGKEDELFFLACLELYLKILLERTKQPSPKNSSHSFLLSFASRKKPVSSFGLEISFLFVR